MRFLGAASHAAPSFSFSSLLVASTLLLTFAAQTQASFGNNKHDLHRRHQESVELVSIANAANKSAAQQALAAKEAKKQAKLAKREAREKLQRFQVDGREAAAKKEAKKRALAAGVKVKRGPSATPTTTSSAAQPTCTCANPAGQWEQCGGWLWSGKTCCVDGYYCYKSSDFYSQVSVHPISILHLETDHCWWPVHSWNAVTYLFHHLDNDDLFCCSAILYLQFSHHRVEPVWRSKLERIDLLR